MSDPRSQHVESGETLHLNRLLGLSPGLGDIPQNDGPSHRLAVLRIFFVGHQRNDIEIQNPILRIKNLQVAAHRTTASAAQGAPIDPSHDLSKRLANAGVGLDPEKTTRCAIQVEDASLGIGDDDALEDGIEDGFQEPLLSRDFDEVVLHLAGLHQRKPLDQLVQKSPLHWEPFLHCTACSRMPNRAKPRAPGRPLPELPHPPKGSVDGEKVVGRFW